MPDRDAVVFSYPYQTEREVAIVAVIELTDATFEPTITGNNFVIVDFWAPWCQPCRSFAPIFERVSQSFDKVVFAKVNTDEQQRTAAHFQIRSIPTLMIFREQILIFRDAGAPGEQQFRKLVEQANGLNMDDVRAQIAAESKTKA